MKPVGLVLTVFVVLVTGSLNVQQVEQFKESFGGRVSNNINEDASLDVPQLVRKYRYPLEEHSVTTEDGYILTMHRIPYGRDANNQPYPSKPVVFVMHGLLCSSADFVLMGPGDGLGYILAEEGFDVWLGNARGNYYSRKHVKLNPDSIFDHSFWNFSWDEIGNKDLPAMIDYILKFTNKDKIHYIGHSQGTTSFFVMGSLRPEYNKKIISMHAMAPVAYLANCRNQFFNALAPYAKDITLLDKMIGIAELLPNNQVMTWAGQALCSNQAMFQPLCENMFFLIAGWDTQQLNSTMLPVILGHSPAGMSVLQATHYAQGIVDKDFRRLDHGILTNLRLYGTTTPPKYDLSKVTAPVYLHYADNDILATEPDVTRLFKELAAPKGMFKVPMVKFNHIDFMWGINAKTLIYDRIINFMRAA